MFIIIKENSYYSVNTLIWIYISWNMKHNFYIHYIFYQYSGLLGQDRLDKARRIHNPRGNHCQKSRLVNMTGINSIVNLFDIAIIFAHSFWPFFSYRIIAYFDLSFNPLAKKKRSNWKKIFILLYLSKDIFNSGIFSSNWKPSCSRGILINWLTDFYGIT